MAGRGEPQVRPATRRVSGGVDHAAIRIVVAILILCTARVAAADSDAIERGRYIFDAGGCYGCHTDIKGKGPPLAGGRALVTPFGTFYGPNITPDKEHGIGAWTDAEFIRALRDGIAPGGSHYYPVFPYTSFTGIRDRDLLDLKAYLFSLPPVPRENTPHEVSFPSGWRWPMMFWKWLNFESGPLVDEPERSPEWNRGAYLVRALGHCGECHTPRGLLGGLDGEMAMAGTNEGPDDGSVPNITPDAETGIGDWSADDLAFMLQTGILPDGDVVGALMGEVIDHGTSKLTAEDRAALVVYLRSLTPIRNRIGKPKTE